MPTCGECRFFCPDCLLSCTLHDEDTTEDSPACRDFQPIPTDDVDATDVDPLFDPVDEVEAVGLVGVDGYRATDLL